MLYYFFLADVPFHSLSSMLIMFCISAGGGINGGAAAAGAGGGSGGAPFPAFGIGAGAGGVHSTTTEAIHHAHMAHSGSTLTAPPDSSKPDDPTPH